MHIPQVPCINLDNSTEEMKGGKNIVNVFQVLNNSRRVEISSINTEEWTPEDIDHMRFVV